MRLRLSVPLALILLEAVPAAALTPHLVKDIDPSTSSPDSNPHGFVAVGRVAFFSAVDSLTGRELWRTDGTPAGTFQIVDACPGPCQSGPASVAQNGRSYFFTTIAEGSARELWVSGGLPANTFRLTDPLRFPRKGVWSVWSASQGVLYFAADDGIHGMELWRTDGTRAGTHLAVDIRPGPAGSEPSELTDFNGRLFFRADDGQRGPSLWKSDGTAAGTRPVRDPIPGAAAHGGPAFLRVAGRTLFFVAPVKNRGSQLWKSDGTTAGTAALTNTGFASFLEFAAIGNRLFFVASDAARGQELWVSDGRAGGTRPLTNLPKADAFGQLHQNSNLLLLRFSLGKNVLFHTDDGPHGAELWTTDGTPKGTRMIRDLCPGTCWGVGFTDPVAVGGRAFFTAVDGLHGPEPWTTDGTAAGTRMIRDLCAGENCHGAPLQWRVGKDKAFFIRHDDTGARVPQLWSTDGTAAGTVRLTSFTVGGVLEINLQSTVLAGRLLFNAFDPAFGWEPWISDGTPQGTRLAADVNATDLGGSSPHDLKSAGGKAYFFARDGQHDTEALWVSDGTEAGTSFLLEPFTAQEIGFSRPHLAAVAEAGGQAFLILGLPQLYPEYYNDYSLWRSDGTPGGTVRLTPETVRINTFEPLTALGHQVFFAAEDEFHGEELWASDGTVEGTRMAVDLSIDAPDYPGSSPGDLRAFQGRLYFSATVGEEGRELRSSDGTPGGTVLVKDLRSLYSSEPHLLAEHAGRLYFTAFDDQSQKLWSTDGTAAGTLPVDLTTGADNLVPNFMVSAGSRFFLWAATFAPNGAATSDYGLWVSDGTAAGTRRLSDGALDDSREIARPIVYNGAVYFGSTNGVLWKSDGTEAGTHPLLTREGQEIRYPISFRIFGGRLVFTTYFEGGLYESDGTQAGTVKLLQLNGPDNVDLFELALAGSRLLFQHWDRDHGFELWGLAAE